MKKIKVVITTKVTDAQAEELKQEILSGKMQREMKNGFKGVKITYEELNPKYSLS